MFDRNLDQWFDESRRDDNPYLTEWFAVAVLTEQRNALFSRDRAAWHHAMNVAMESGTYEFAARETLVGKYAWAVPCEAALTVLAKHAPLIEVGAGVGYWAWLLRKRGVDVLAFDANPPPDEVNHYHKGNECWTKVERGGPEFVESHAERTLFLCWPPYDEPFAADCLKRYAGGVVIFVGEHGGCCADSEFFNLLERDWESQEEVNLPQYEHIRDYLTVYTRKAQV